MRPKWLPTPRASPTRGDLHTYMNTNARTSTHSLTHSDTPLALRIRVGNHAHTHTRTHKHAVSISPRLSGGRPCCRMPCVYACVCVYVCVCVYKRDVRRSRFVCRQSCVRRCMQVVAIALSFLRTLLNA